MIYSFNDMDTTLQILFNYFCRVVFWFAQHGRNLIGVRP